MNSAPASPGREPAAADRRLPRAAHLRTQADFDRVFRSGRKTVNDRLVVWIAPAPAGVARPRLGLSVGRRVGGAVARNRVKRVLREAFRHLAPALSEAVDIVIIARPASAPTSAAAAREALDDALRRHARRAARPR